MNFDNFERFLQKYNMLPPGSRVLCAVSGGADSVCLLHLIASRRDVFAVCAHYNHQLRGAESDRDEQFVAALCEKLGVEFVCGRGDVLDFAERHGLGIEEAARRLRYDFLEETARTCRCGRIATAHNANDNAETVLLNLTRGAGLRGLCGIPPVRGDIVRPLLQMTRAQIEAYLAEHGLSYVEDSTNDSDAYSRNRLRHHVLPVLEGINPGAAENIFRCSESLRQDEAYLSALAQRFVEENYRDGRLLIRDFSAQPQPVQMRILRLVCGPALSGGHAQTLAELCRAQTVRARADIPGMHVTRERDMLLLGRPEAAFLPPRAVIPGQIISLPETGMKIICEKTVFDPEIHKSFNTFCFKSESICGTILVTSRQQGDKVALEGRGCTKMVRKLFSERAVPLHERGTIPVFRDDRGVIAVYGFGKAARCRCSAGDAVIKIEVTE